MQITSLIFGSLGTLTETSHIHHRAFNDTFAQGGLDWHWDDETYKQLLGIVGGAARIHQFALTQDGPDIDEAAAAELHARKTERYVQLVRNEGVELRPGVERLIAEARSAGIPVGLATGTSPDNLEANLEAAGGRLSYGSFDAVTTRSAGLAPKPAPDIHLECLRRLQVDAPGAVTIEDTADGVESAAAAGTLVVATPGRYVTDQNFEAAKAVITVLGDDDVEAKVLRGDLQLDDGIVTLRALADLAR